MLHPIGGAGPGAESLLDNAVHPFYHAIALWVVGRSSKTLDAEELMELLPQRRRELSPLIRGNVGWNTETGNPVPVSYTHLTLPTNREV